MQQNNLEYGMAEKKLNKDYWRNKRLSKIKPITEAKIFLGG
jgi:hypothetical protein